MDSFDSLKKEERVNCSKNHSVNRATVNLSLQALNPNVASQWHTEKNGNLTASDVKAGSKKKVWWQCEKGHTWEATIQSRAKYGNGCPFCSGKYVSPENSLQTLWPELSEQWHPSKNGSLTPNDVTAGSNKKVWWKCKQGHEWQSVIYSRCRAKSVGCPICNQGKQTSFPEQAIYFYFKSAFKDTLSRYKYNNKWEIDIFIPSLNFGIEYDGVFFHKDKNTSDSKKEKNITGQGVHLLKIKEIDGKIENSYINKSVIHCSESPSEAQLDAIVLLCFDYVSKNLTSQIHFADIDVKRDRALIYDLYIKTEEAESLSTKYPKISAQWHPTRNLSIRPTMVKYGSSKKVWWQCEKGHEWEEIISNRIAGRNCPYCSGHRVCIDNSLQTLNPNLSKQWHPRKNADLTPDHVTTNSNKKVWWKCGQGHECYSQATLSQIRREKCPNLARRVVPQKSVRVKKPVAYTQPAEQGVNALRKLYKGK